MNRIQPDSGAYIIVFHLTERQSIQIGKLGAYDFEAGYYYYVGSALKSLNRRVGRHLRKEKKLRWHIDYLSVHCEAKDYYLIPSVVKEECSIAQYFLAHSDFIKPVKNFGSSDCNCYTHLFYNRNQKKIENIL